jgi:antitoxin component YwqK of YwqJK toxin-antitoxin module
MKVMVVLIALFASIALAWTVSVWWWLGPQTTVQMPVGPRQIHGAERADGPDPARLTAVRTAERLRVPMLVDASVEHAQPDTEPTEPRDPFELLWREPPVVDGPRIESNYPSGGPEFRGTQVRDANGAWIRDGAWTAWHENGQVLERGAYREGVEDGPWQWWYEDGRPMAEGSWIEGARNGPWTFWREDGHVMMQGHYTSGVGDGVWTLYDESGYKQAQGPFEQGVASGYWTVWNADGSLNTERTGLYEDGRKVD